ncbi:motility protein A [uncultured Tyzzerella sp.]|uniref:motility protein A n=1 Tax=uncultured Tyzzerella sp. TaxID=2321398 RepID=UPI0029428648|nr:motility protein A [uncultured Tyzzerella sp.]
MELGFIIGLVAGIGFTLISIFLAGDMNIGAVVSFLDAPSFMITVGGAMSAVIASYPLPKFVNAMKSVNKILKPETIDPIAAIKDVIELANVARKEGLLALDDKSVDMDPFLRKGIMLVVDGTDQELVRNVLETEMAYIEDRHKDNIGVWELMASQFPAWGMIGTLIGLVIMLQNMDDPSSIGPKMAVALITTFYGSLFANWISSPVANKMKFYSKQEMLVKEVTIEGILSVAAGENPRIIEEKLKVFISPTLRSEFGEGDSE